MLNKIISFSIKNKLIVILSALALVIYGSFELTKLPIDAVPDITDNQVQVITVTPTLGAPDVERLITFPIEQANSNIQGLKEIRSFSRFGLSLVTIVFDDATDVYWARQQVTERLQNVQASIPRGIGTPYLAPVSTGLGEVYQYVVRPQPGFEARYDAMELRTIQDWIVRRQLLGTEGVADVSSFGGYLKQYEVAVDAAKLASLNVTISELCTALESNNSNTGGAYIEKGPTVLYIRSEGLAGSITDIENIVVKQLPGGSPVFVRDVGEVRIGAATRYGAMCYNDHGEVAGAVVMMLKGENSGQVIRRIKDKIESIKSTLPEGVTIEPFLDRSKMVNNAIGTVEKNLLEGSLIVVFILVLFLGNLRAGILVASIIPLSMLFAIIMMNIFGVSGNLMSLGALDFGLIVDGAVIIVEAVMHKLHLSRFQHNTRLTQKQMDTEVETSAGRMMNSAIFGQIIILIVYIPIFSLRGIEGKMFRPMAQTVAFALAGAFILSLTYIPAMSALFLSKKISNTGSFSDRMMQKLETRFHQTLGHVLKYPKMVIAVSLSLFVGSLVLLLSLGGEFIPQLEEGDFAIDTRVLTGSNLHTTIDVTQKASGILLAKFPEVEKVVAKIGSGEIPTDPMPVEACDLMVILKDKEEWTSAKSFPELAEKMGTALDEIPGITTGFQFPVQMRFNELMTGARQDVVCKIFGEDLDTLAHYAGKLGGLASTVEGAKDIYIETVTGLPQIIIRYNRASIAQYGLNVEDVNSVVSAAFGGRVTGNIYEGEKRFDMVVRLEGKVRERLEDVQNLLIPAANGTQVPLNLLASVTIENGPNQVQRENAHRRIIVGFNVRGRDVQTIVDELQKKTQQLKLPTGYYITYGGAFENLIEAKKRLSIVVPLALSMIFLMLYFAFRSVKHSLIIYSAIPLSAIGGAIALALRGMPFSISAGVGFIALFGVAVLNGIVLISEFRKIKAEGITDLKDIVLKGTTTRLRPVLMTAAVASLGFLPMALSNGAGAEVQRPLATVVIGGLFSATLLTLFLLPVLYIAFDKTRIRMSNKTIGLLLLASLLPKFTEAQTIISLDAAVDSALHNNLEIKTRILTDKYHEKNIGSGWDIGKTSLTAEWGNVNSAYNDTRYGISQSISFPLVYARHTAVLRTEWASSKAQTEIRKKELAQQVATLYCDINILLNKKTLLLHADNLYAEFETKATMRFELGETNVLEKNTAQNLRGQIALQLGQLSTDIEILVRRFNYLLNTTQEYIPSEKLFRAPQRLNNTQMLMQHPQISYLRLQRESAELQYKLEKTRLLPELVGGYYNQSYSGWQKIGSTDKLFTIHDRFSSVQLGVGIPVFSFSQSSKIKSALLSGKIAAAQQENGIRILEMQYNNVVANFNKQVKTVAYYEHTGVKNAKEAIEAATQKFQQGDISYLEYVILLNQAFTIQNEYYEELRKLNAVIFEMDYLTNNQ